MASAVASVQPVGTVVRDRLAELSTSPWRWLLLFGLVLTSMMELLDTAIINPVLPTMAGNLGATTEEISWVSTSYILANVIMLPLTAWFARRFGLKRYLTVSIVVFLIASVLCGLSSSLGQITIWRLAQGASGAALISMTQTAIAQVFKGKERGAAQGLWALGITFAPSVAPTMGGWIADNYSWSWVFFINIPIGAVAILIVQSLYHENVENTAGKVDWLGMGLLAAGLGSLQYILEEGNRNDWFESDLIRNLTFVAFAGIGSFIWWELSPRNKAPVLNLRLLKDRTLGVGTVLTFVIGFGLYSSLFVFPIFSQRVLGFNSTASGMFLLLPGCFLAFSMIITSQMLQRGVAARDLVVTGYVILIYAMWLMGHMSPQSNASDAGFALGLRGLAIGMCMLPIVVSSIGGLQGTAVAEGSAVTSVMRLLGGSVGIAALNTYLTRQVQEQRAVLDQHMALGDPITMSRIAGITQGMMMKGMDATHAHAVALKLMDLNLSNQAYTRAVNASFIATGVIFACSLPLVFLMKRTKSGGPPADAH